MCHSIFLAQVIGCYLLFTSLARLVHQQRFKKAMHDVLTNSVLITASGILHLFVGLLIVVSHNVWISAWPVLITIIGWILILQGLVRLFLPEAFVKLVKEILSNSAFTLLSWIFLAVGVILIWAGFSQA